jgi:hypothetical protein
MFWYLSILKTTTLPQERGSYAGRKMLFVLSLCGILRMGGRVVYGSSLEMRSGLFHTVRQSQNNPYFIGVF